MKTAILGVVILAALLLCLPACAPAISPEKYDELRSNLDDAQCEIDELREDLATLQTNYENLLERLRQSTLENPAWSELKGLLAQDDTDMLPYHKDSFDCADFAITLRDRMWKYGVRCAYVEVSFSEGEGHALNAFETTDNGLIYVDNTRADQIAYAELNQPYGTIHLDGVKFKYIACSGSPSEFWTSLTYATHPNPFSYDYYIDYQRRRGFYQESVTAYNNAVGEYNEGSAKWSYSQLATWRDNLNALEKDLGLVFYEPAGEVRNIEVYWN